MRTIRHLTLASLCIVTLVACARVAAAQTYVWTDEHGVVHAAADPSEVPPQYRQKSVRDASNARPAVKVVPEESAPVPAAPRAAPMGTDDEPARAPDPDGENGGKKYKGKLPPPDEGFEWHCLTDPEGGPPKCEQLEKKNVKKQRRADAREKARHDLGVSPTDELDPDVAKKVDQRAEQEFKKTTPTPTTKAPKPSEDDDGESDSSDDSN